jgi:uncharacterized protein (TIGR01777 family)
MYLMSHKILITGGTGLIGATLTQLLVGQGHDVRVLSRSKKEGGNVKYFQWDISKKYIEEGALDVDYIIHLAGAGIADKKWTNSRKLAIINSRVESTRLLKQELQKMKGPKPGYIGASAIGIYGNSDNHALTEEEASNDRDDFLVDVVQKWEEAHLSLKDVVNTHAIVRIGIVLSTDGGALKPMLIPFMFRVGNYFGDGSQVFSWIHIDDLCQVFSFIIENEISGIYNGVAPNAVNGKELVSAIAKVKSGPFLQFGVPEFALKLVFGEMSQAILASTWVSSNRLEEQKFAFKFPQIQSAIADLLK